MKCFNKDKFLKVMLILIISLFIINALALPVFFLFQKAFYDKHKFVGFNNFRKYFCTGYLIDSFYNSIFVSVSTAVLAVILVFLFCYALERTNIKGKKIYKIIAIMPLLAPAMTYGIGLIYLFGKQGIISTGFWGRIRWLSMEGDIYGKWGIILGECIYVFPSVFLIFSVAFKMIDYRYYEVAEIFGIKKIKMFFTITLPALKFSIVSAFFTAFTLVFADFGIPKVIGGNYNVLAADIYKQVIGQQDFTMGAVSGIFLIIPSLIGVVVNKIIDNKKDYFDLNSKEFVIKDNKYRDLLFTVYNVIISSVVVIIFITVFIAAFVENWPYNFSFTFKWFHIKTFGASILSIYKNTLIVSILTASIGTIIVFLTAYITERENKFKIIRKWIHFNSILPLSLPGLAIGLSYILYFNHKGTTLNFIYGTFIILVLVNIIHFFSVPYLSIVSNMRKIDNEYENISKTMGVPWYKVLIYVIVPMSIPAIAESFSYYFINSMTTISAVMFLYTSKTRLLSVEMINRFDIGNTANAAAIAVIIFITNLILKIIYQKIIFKGKKY